MGWWVATARAPCWQAQRMHRWQTTPFVSDDDFDAHFRINEIAWEGGSLTATERGDLRTFYGDAPFVGVRADGELVGSCTWFPLQLTVPGPRSIAATGLSQVAMLPTHRRRGILRSLISAHLAAARQGGRAISVLSASQGAIYGKVGYGVGALQAKWTVPARTATVPRSYAGRLVFPNDDEARTLLPQAHERARRQRSGELSRSKEFWDALFDDRPNGYMRSPLARRHVVAQGADGGIDGYAGYYHDVRWTTSSPTGTVDVQELVAADGDAEAAILRFLLDTDLTDEVHLRARPLDDALRWHLADPRALRCTDLSDGMWLRLVDVATALPQRRYAGAGSLRIAVRDALVPQNDATFLLEVDDDGTATCSRVSDQPHLTLDVGALASVFLGTFDMSTAARSGRAEELSDGALQAADAVFAVEAPPWCTTFVQ